jgi:hypothetical protein
MFALQCLRGTAEHRFLKFKNIGLAVPRILLPNHNVRKGEHTGSPLPKQNPYAYLSKITI